jgi:hypothetical protein
MGERQQKWSIDLDDEQWSARSSDGGWWRVEASPWYLEVAGRLVGAVLEIEVEEHHLLAAHGEGLFYGLSDDLKSWALQLERLMPQLDELRVIVQQWPPGHRMMSMTEVKARGWNQATIDALLEPAAVMPNPHYASGGQMVLFDTRHVMAAERSEAWLTGTARLRSQRVVRALCPGAGRSLRQQAATVAALDPAVHGLDLVELAAAEQSGVIAEIAIRSLSRHWEGRAWTCTDLSDPGLAPLAALLGDDGVASEALRHSDPLVVRVATLKVIAALAG